MKQGNDGHNRSQHPQEHDAVYKSLGQGQKRQDLGVSVKKDQETQHSRGRYAVRRVRQVFWSHSLHLIQRYPTQPIEWNNDTEVVNGTSHEWDSDLRYEATSKGGDSDHFLIAP